MNIFYVNEDPVKAAQSLVDSHVVKMVLESAQLLSTAHRVLDGKETIELSANNRRIKRWVLPDNREGMLYKATHSNHPSAVWCRASNNNYRWLYDHFVALLNEYTYRYGKVHESSKLVKVLRATPKNITAHVLVAATPAMPFEYLVEGNAVESYRNYYRVGKAHLHKYTKRQPPDWLAIS